MRVPQNRRGFSGWKLTKRPLEIIDKAPGYGGPGPYMDTASMMAENMGMQKRGKSKKRGGARGHQGG